MTPDPAKKERERASAPWTFFSNHAHVLIYLADNGDARLRDVAEAVGITERSVQMIVADLEEAEVLERTRVGRRNRYSVNEDLPLRHPVEEHCKVRDLLRMIRRAR
jgi:DNA-binding MarR family transcriptional regulator